MPVLLFLCTVCYSQPQIHFTTVILFDSAYIFLGNESFNKVVFNASGSPDVSMNLESGIGRDSHYPDKYIAPFCNFLSDINHVYYIIKPEIQGCLISPIYDSIRFESIIDDIDYPSIFNAIDTAHPQVTVLEPASSDIIHINHIDSVKISFTDNSHYMNRSEYSISYDNKATWEHLFTFNEQRGDSRPFTKAFTPNKISTSCIVRVIIKDPTGNADTGFSPIFSCIDTVVPTVTINSPTTCNAGRTYPIAWTADDNVELKAWAVYTAKNGTSFVKLDSADNTSTTCSWSIPNDYLTTTCKIKVNVYDQSGNSASDISNAFPVLDTIKPTVAITAPVIGTAWNIGTSYSISWNYTDNSESFKSRAIYIDNILIDSSVSATGNFSWVAAGAVSTITIRVNVYDPSGNKNTTTRTVSLVDGTNPTIAISEPVGGSSYYSSASLRVRWTASDNGIIAGVSFYLAFNNGDFFYMDSVAGNPEVITLKIPDTIYTNSNTVVQCKIYDTEGNMSSAMSDPFSVKNIFPVSGKISLDSSIVYLEDIDTIKMSFNDRSRIVNYGVNLSTDSGKTFRNLFVQLCSLEPKTVHNLTWLWTVGAYGKGIESDKCFLRFYTGDQQIPSSRDSLTSKMFKIEKRPETSVVKKYIPIKKVPENYTYFSLNGQVRSFSRSSVFFIKADNRVKKSLLIK